MEKSPSQFEVHKHSFQVMTDSYKLVKQSASAIYSTPPVLYFSDTFFNSGFKR